MGPTDVILRYADYAGLPADGRRYELHRGELIVTAAPSPLHQTVAANLYRLLYPAVRARQVSRGGATVSRRRDGVAA